METEVIRKRAKVYKILMLIFLGLSVVLLSVGLILSKSDLIRYWQDIGGNMMIFSGFSFFLTFIFAISHACYSTFNLFAPKEKNDDSKK